MAKWDAALDARKLLKQSSYDAMWSPVKLNNGKTYPYGFGWFLSDENGKKVVVTRRSMARVHHEYHSVFG